jgi:radical SAM superfamily enzyme
MDIPDLPLVLQLLDSYERGGPLVPERSPLFDRYCIERGISPQFLNAYLVQLDRYMAAVFAQIPRIDFIGFTTWTANYLPTLFAAAHLKRRQKPPVIVAGGPQVTASNASAALGLRAGLFDVVATSEGEETLYELYTAFDRTGVIPIGLPGTVTLDHSNGSLVRTERRLGRLDLMPMPSYDEIPIEAYQQDDGRALPLHFSRGCTDKCSFCSEWVFWQKFRPDSPEHTVENIKELKRRYNADFIQFYDSLMNGHHKRLVAFAEQMLRENVQVGWTSSMRAQMDPETAKLIARSGCIQVFVGIESFSDETLALMNKRRTEADNIQSVIAFLEAGIDVTAGFIPGFPGDTRRGFLHSVEVMRKLQERFPGQLDLHEEPFTVAVGAPMHDKLEELGLVGRTWADEYLDIAPRFRDITSPVWCEVEGSAQGLERIGRATIVGTIKTDRPVRNFFDPAPNEELPIDAFFFEHVHGGWSMARKKSAAGHRYCLLVNDEERDEILALQDELYPKPLDESSDRKAAALLRRIERRHASQPSRLAPRMARFLYRRDAGDEAVYTPSPLVIARSMGWRHRNPLLAVDTVMMRSFRHEAAAGLLLELLHRKASTLAELWNAARRRGLQKDLHWVRDTVTEMKEQGIIIICEMAEEVATATGERPAEAAEGVAVVA